MKTRFTTTAVLAVIALSTAVSAQNYYDDDIYYDSAKARKAHKEAIEAARASTLPGPENYVELTDNDRDVDEYNRRSSSSLTSSISESALETDPYYYTRQIARFDNSELLNQLDDSTAYAIAVTDPKTVNLTVNNYTYGTGGGWDICYTPWAFNRWLSPGWAYYYSPWLPVYYDYYWGPGWSYVPGWAMGGGWGPAYPVWKPAPHPNHVYTPNRHYSGTYRPAYGVGTSRPNSASSGTRRASGATRPSTTSSGSYLGNGYRPGTTGAGSRPSSMSTQSGTRRGSYTGSRSTSTSSGSYRSSGSTNRNSDVVKGSHSSGSRSSYSGGSGTSRGGYSGGGTSRSGGGGGGRGRH